MSLEKTYLVSVHKSLSEIDFIKVWKLNEPFKPIFLKRIQLKGIRSRIIFSIILSNQSVLVVDHLAKVSIIDISDSNILVEKDFRSMSNCSVRLDQSEETLYLGLTLDEYHQKKILQLRLPDLKLIKEISLPREAVFNPFWVFSSSKIYVYFQAGGDLNQRLDDGLYMVDLTNQTVQSLVFSPVSNTFDSQPPIDISEKFGMGARIDYTGIEIRTTSGKKKYLAKLQIFDLENCNPLKTIEVREFLPEHVFEDVDPALALSNLELPEEEEEYQDSQSEFLERITSIKFCHLEKAIWIGFQHGLIRKVYLDDKRCSPLFSYPLMRSDETCDPYLLAEFNNPLVLKDDDQKIGFGSPRIDVSVKDLELDSKLSLIPLPYKHYTRSMYVTSETDFEALSWNTFEIKDKSLLNVLREITLKVTDNTLTIDGSYLRLRFKCENGVFSEKEFFQRVVGESGWELLTEKYIRQVTELSLPLYSRHLVPVGYYAICSMIDRSNNCGELLNLYLSSNTIPAGCGLKELSKAINLDPPWSQLKLELLLNYSIYPDSRGFDLLQEVLKTSDFNQFINSEKIKHLFQNHPLIVELGDDLFDLLHPLEDQLFEAISWGNLAKVIELTNQGVDLNCSHPDFKYSALMCAIEMENDEIAKFLVQHGANIEQSDILE